MSSNDGLIIEDLTILKDSLNEVIDEILDTASEEQISDLSNVLNNLAEAVTETRKAKRRWEAENK